MMAEKQGRSASQGEACLHVEKMMGCEVEMPELQFVEPQKIGSRPGFLKNVTQFGRMQSKKEGSNGISRVIWEISVKTITKKNEVYDTATDTWSERASIPSLRNNPALATMDSLIYVIGGAGSENSIWETIAAVECYNSKTDKWTTKSDLPFELFKPGAVVVNNKIVLLGGQNTRGESLSDVLIYDSRSDTWKKTTPLPRINCFAGYASVANKIYVMGGTTSSPDWTYYSDVYEGTLMDPSITSVDSTKKKK